MALLEAEQINSCFQITRLLCKSPAAATFLLQNYRKDKVTKFLELKKSF